MKQIIEIVPNYSEGKSQVIMDQIIAPFRTLSGIKLLRLEMDASYNRSVVTIIGEVEPVLTGVIESAIIASRLIDLRIHQGEHPRMGALDVLPIIPIQGISEAQCTELAYKLGEEIFKKTQIPVYYYAKSAKRSQCENLPDIRKGEFEGLQEKMQDPYWKPDLGEAPHEKAGAIAIGCRKPLIAFNIDTDSSSKKLVLKIARKIRYSGGGYRFIQAGAAKLEEKNICQVTMNLTDYTQTALYQAIEAVKMEGYRYGIKITNTEIVGLIPLSALTSSLNYYLQKDEEEILNYSFSEIVELAVKHFKLRDFSQEKIIEYYVQSN